MHEKSILVFLQSITVAAFFFLKKIKQIWFKMTTEERITLKLRVNPLYF